MTASPVSTATLLEQLRWRYATKQFDPAKKIPAADWEALEPALLLTPTKYDQVLGLTERGLRATVACAAGYRAATDKYAGLPKVRFPASELVVKI